MKYTHCLRPVVMALILACISGTAFSAENGLVKPNQLIFDKALSAKQIAANESVARKYATFWDTGKRL